MYMYVPIFLPMIKGWSVLNTPPPAPCCDTLHDAGILFRWHVPSETSPLLTDDARGKNPLAAVDPGKDGIAP